MQIVQHELKKDKQTDWELEYLCDSHIHKFRSQDEKYAFEDLWRMTIFLILLNGHELFV